METQSEESRIHSSSKREYWIWIAFLWLGFGLVNATQTVVGMRVDGMHHAWGRLFFTVLASWLVWLLATPLIQRAGRRFPPIHWRPLSSWLVHLAMGIAVGAVHSAWAAWLLQVLHPWGSDAANQPFTNVWFYVAYNGAHIFLILYAAILAISYYLDSRKRLVLRETEAAHLNERLSKAKLDALRRQLEPHFLFNTLNAVAGLVRERRNDDAVNMIAGLSTLLRRVLEGSDTQEVPLGEEMEMLGKYLDIQKMRFADRLQVTVDVPRELLATQVPSLILQPMVENAIQHGIGRRMEGGIVRIAASRSNGLLTVSIHNDGPPLPVDWQHAGSGIGISNARARLQSLYGERWMLNVQNHETGGVEVLLSVPYRTCVS